MAEDIKCLTRIADIKEALIKEVLATTTEQGEALAVDDFGRLLELTDKKQEQINKLEKVANYFRSNYDLLNKGSKACEDLRYIKKKMQEIREVADIISKLEKENKSCLTQKMSKVKEGIKNLYTEKKAMNSYMRIDTVVSRHIDQNN